ncbi:MAG: helix-turn-helix domain-containing protein [Acidobacteria bacterium]|nr:helix-turn-helix domain-containing protein [Candidatus Sulfomarinibacter kjeldsenii]
MVDRIEEAYRRILGTDPPAAPQPSPAGNPAVATDSVIGDAPDPISDPGAHLRFHRTAKGVTLHEIAVETKIGITILEQIENEEFEALPAPAFVRGHVHQFARELKIPPRKIPAISRGTQTPNQKKGARIGAPSECHPDRGPEGPSGGICGAGQKRITPHSQIPPLAALGRDDRVSAPRYPRLRRAGHRGRERDRDRNEKRAPGWAPLKVTMCLDYSMPAASSSMVVVSDFGRSIG